MAKIITLPGAYNAKAEEADNALTPGQCLLNALEEPGLQGVAIVGRDLQGEVIVWSDRVDIDQTIGLLERGILWLASRDQIADENEEEPA